MKNNNHTVLRSVKMAFEIMPGHFSCMIAVHLAIAVLPLFGMQMSRRIYGFAQSSAGSSMTSGQIAAVFVLYAGYLLLLKAYVVYYQRVAVQFGGLLRFEKKAKLILHEKCDQIDMFLYENPEFYNGLWEAKVASINVYRLVECIISLVCIGINILVMSGYASTIHPSFFALVVLTAVPALAEKLSAAILKNKRRRELTQLSRTERAFRTCLTGIPFAKERIVYDNYDFLSRKWNEAAQDYLDKDYDIGKKTLQISAALTVLKAASVAGVYVLAGWLFYVGKISFADFMVAISTTLYLQSQYSELFSDLGYFSEFQMMVKPYFRFMDTDPKSSMKKPDGRICFENVGFSYPTSDKNILTSLNFSIHPGEKIAIVGVNGAGKTTLSKLLVGLLPPTSGRIGGQLSSDYCVMFQDFQKYALSLSENIALNEIIPSRPACIDQLINEMNIQDIPDHVILGREFGETDLSGGQWQKIAMARLFYHNGDLLVLDEPTSAIDAIYEKDLNDLILKNAGNDKTLIVISHRLSIARLVDRIFVLNNGTIVEQGNHETLIKNPNSLYAKLWAAQISWYE